MLWFQYVIYGIIASTVSIILPGMLNMTVVAISMERGLRAGVRFSVGAGLVFIGYAMIALAFADFLSKHPEVFQRLKILILFLLLILGFVFYRKARRSRAMKAKKTTKDPFWAGVFITLMNAMLLPYFFAVGAYLETKGLMDQQRSATLLFSAGAGVGAFLSFVVYARFAQFIAKRSVFITRNINYIISILFFILALVQMGNLLNFY